MLVLISHVLIKLVTQYNKYKPMLGISKKREEIYGQENPLKFNALSVINCT